MFYSENFQASRKLTAVFEAADSDSGSLHCCLPGRVYTCPAFDPIHLPMSTEGDVLLSFRASDT